MTANLANLTGPIVDCWSRIGVAGDLSCPELREHIHCRNCPVFASAARSFFDRPAPEDYWAEWTRLLARQESPTEDDRVSVVAFRLHGEWLALDTQVVVEVTAVRPVHRIPHRSNHILVGLVNLRGQLFLCASLHGLLGVEPLDSSGSPGAPAGERSPNARMILIRQGAESWVFAADEVLGVERWPREQMAQVPATLANPAVSFSRAVFHAQERSVGILDDRRIFAALRSLGL